MKPTLSKSEVRRLLVGFQLLHAARIAAHNASKSPVYVRPHASKEYTTRARIDRFRRDAPEAVRVEVEKQRKEIEALERVRLERVKVSQEMRMGEDWVVVTWKSVADF